MDSTRYGATPAVPQYNVGEAPACVQNAMMTKDKKPFTYTPGGIDLSQIKSQRMAKRLARNAQSEGATGQQQQNRPTPPPQQHNNGGTPPAAASQLGATAMGMPFQVLPSGPPPPPPQPGRGGAPPPPPPAPQNKLAPQANGNAAQTRRSPTPQNFEPPPMGLRPEIKIPPNPMAALKKVPPPKEKNNFWVEEYRKERSKSPMVGNDENDNNRSPPNNPQPETNQCTQNNNNNTNSQPQQNKYRSPSPQPMRPPPQEYQRAPSPSRTPMQQMEQPRRIESPFQAQNSPQTQYSPQPQQQQQSPVHKQSSLYQPQYQAPQQSSPQQQRSPAIQRQQTAPPKPQQYQSPTSPQYQQQPQPQTSPTQQQSVPWRSQKPVATAMQNNVSRPRDVMSPAPSESPRPQQPAQQQSLPQQQQYPGYLRSREVHSPAPELQPPQILQPYQQKNAQVGSIYVPPVVTQPKQTPKPQQQQQQQQQPPSSRQVPANRWASPQQPSMDSQTMNRIKSPPPQSSSNNTGLRLQINNNTSNLSGKERIVPIQLEQTPTPTRTPAAPGFGPQPYYNAGQQQCSNVPSPPLAQGTHSNGQNSPSYIVRSPNQFVDQGYNNYPVGQDPNRVTSPTMQQMQSPRIGGVKSRIIPIAVDSHPDGPLNPNNVRGPISQQPLVIQNDPRNPNAWGSGSATPNQSKSFRVLQKITDTADGAALESKAIESDGGDQEPQLQKPSYARQMAPGQVNSPTIDQKKRMQLNNEQAFGNRVKNQGTSPAMKQPQPNRYAIQRPVYSPEEQQYVHPSEQQVPEPKKYTGSAIPSRSFKILQAMTTPENAAEMECSDVVETNKLITEYPYQQPPPPHPYAYPYPYLPPCCLPPPPPPQSPNGDVQNWPYALPHHHNYSHPYHHPHPHHHAHPHQHHPCPPCPCYYYYPLNEYDSQNCSQYPGRDSFRRSHSKSQDPPDIIITPSAEDIPQKSRKKDLGREEREGSVIETLSRRLSEISKPVNVDLNMSQDDDKNYVGDSGKEFANNSPSPIKSECENSKIASESESSDDLLTSSTDQSSSTSIEDCAKQLPKAALQTIKSVTNIQVYNKNASSPLDSCEDDLTVDEGESMIFDDDEEEEEVVVEELEYDEEDMLIEEIDSEDEEEIEELEEDEEVIIMDDLSVIYEENEAELVSPRPTSRVSSSVSGSTTLANEEYKGLDEVIIEDVEDDNSNSVTVRLPLKLSFSRSSNDENIATVEVGHIDQIADKRRSFSIASIEADPEEYDSDCDVSVTISFSPSSGSWDKMAILSPTPRKPSSVLKEEDSGAEDVSASFSLSMRNKFMDQTWRGDVTNNIAEKKKKKIKKEVAQTTIETIEEWRRNSSGFEKNLSTNEDTVKMANSSPIKAEELKKDEDQKDTVVKKAEEVQAVGAVKQPIKENGVDELDFWATLQATRKEAQLFLEKTADYWGKKIDGRKEIPESELISAEKPNESDVSKETEKDDDFWATIRVKDTAKEVTEDIPTKKEPDMKTTKPKKKKKIIIPAPEKETEPENAWGTISLPNAKNKSKIVESTIKMIQDNVKKPKKLLRRASNEVELGEFVGNIRKSFDEGATEDEECKVAETCTTESLATSSKKQIKKEKSEESVATVIVKEDIRSKMVKEKAELRSQILNQAFAQTFLIPKKPIVMKATLSEAEIIRDSNTESVKSSKEVNILIEDSEKLEKQKKKISKSKKVGETAEDGTLHAPKTKAVKKSTKEAKKKQGNKEEAGIAKVAKTEGSQRVEDKFSSCAVDQKEIKQNKTSSCAIKQKDTEIKVKNVVQEKASGEVKTAVQQSVEVKLLSSATEQKDTLIEVKKVLEAKLSSSAIGQNTYQTGKVAEETDFWKEIESTEPTVVRETEPKSEKTDSWANIQPVADKKEETCKTECQETDFWAEIECSKPKDPNNPSVDPAEIDIWTEADYSNVKVEVLADGIDTCTDDESLKTQTPTSKKHKFQEENKEMFEVKTDVWPTAIPLEDKTHEIHSDTVKNQNTSAKIDTWVESSSTYSWSKYDSAKDKQEENVNIWTEVEPSSTSDMFSSHKIESYETKADEASHKIDVWDHFEVSQDQNSHQVPQDCFLNKIDEAKSTEKNNTWVEFSKVQENTDFWAEIVPSQCEREEEGKTKVEEADFWSKIDSVKSECKTSTEDISDNTQKTSPPTTTSGIANIEFETSGTAEVDFWANIESAKTTKTKKTSSLHVYNGYDVDLINLEPIATYYVVHTKHEMPVDLWATTSYVEEQTTSKAQNETEVPSEMDTGKTDFWVTQRKFEACNGLLKDSTPKNEENPEPEVDFWAQIESLDDVKDKVPVANQKEECEVRRKNYKKAMAFFTNTVNVDKKERSLENEKERTPEPLERQAHNSWTWRSSMDQEWEAPENREVTDVFLVVEDNVAEEEQDNLIENKPYDMEKDCAFEMIDEVQCEEEDEESSESISDSTPNHFQIEQQYSKPEPAPIQQRESSLEKSKFAGEIKISVKDRVFAFETGAVESPTDKAKTSNLLVESVTPKSNLSRNSSQRSESEIEEDDSGVTDMNKPLSETDTECDSFPELRKMTSYQRASTHSRLFKLLQDEGDVIEEENDNKSIHDEFEFKHSRKKIVHNVSITRKQNPKAMQDAESMTQRRQRLSLPLRKNSSIDAENPSTPNSPGSPIFGQPSQAVSDKLVNELVQSLLLKKSSSSLKNLPMEKLQAAAKRVLEEELDSLENTSPDSTPALTPQEFKSESYSDYYDSWSAKADLDTTANGSFEILPSKAFQLLQETTATVAAKRRPWSVRCPRVLSSKTVNRDLARVTESPEIYTRSSNSPEVSVGSERASSVGRWRKV